MTQYLRCVECGGAVAWWRANRFGPDAMHPDCAIERIAEEGCGPTWFHLSQDGADTRAALASPTELQDGEG